MSRCPFTDDSSDDEIQIFLEGYIPFKGDYKYINNIMRFKKDCEKCPNYNYCEEWK